MNALVIKTEEPKAHPAAELFPMLDDEQIKPLVDDMREHGFDPQQPILRYGGAILDGRNRLRAAAFAGVEPVFRDLPEDCNPYYESWQRNGLRRDLKPGQRAGICAKITTLSLQWQADQRERQERANAARAEKARAQHAVSNPRAGQSSGRSSNEDPPKSDNRTVTALAEKAGVSRTTMERALKLQKQAPEKLEAVIRGEKSQRKKPPPRVDHDQRKADVRRLHEQGMGTNQIGRQLGIHSKTISALKSDMGIAGTAAPQKLWDDIEHAVAILRGAQPQLDSLTEQLSTTRPAANKKEIKRCINTLENVSRSLRHLRTALSTGTESEAAQ